MASQGHQGAQDCAAVREVATDAARFPNAARAGDVDRSRVEGHIDDAIRLVTDPISNIAPGRCPAWVVNAEA
ncbi:unannotated protein [freshwater metagenome]|uniref:Unannotated protein n=1 Tax=freshwater metagenome TaxID=449393 RepID=A0A6J7HJQ2_9ZZZZ